MLGSGVEMSRNYILLKDLAPSVSLQRVYGRAATGGSLDAKFAEFKWKFRGVKAYVSIVANWQG